MVYFYVSCCSSAAMPEPSGVPKGIVVEGSVSINRYAHMGGLVREAAS